MEWYILAAAVATATSIHSAMEPQNVNRKLARLANALKTGKIDELPMKGIDTRAKSYALGTVFMAILTSVAYFIINLFDPSLEAAMQYSLIVLLVGEFGLMKGLDDYHVAIEKLTKKVAKK